MSSKWHAEYDKAEVTPSEDDAAVGIVGGGDDDTFSREDGAEVRAAAERAKVERGRRPVGPPRDVLG